MSNDPRQEVAEIKAWLLRDEHGPVTTGVAALQRHPVAAAVVALGGGLWLARHPRAARTVLAVAGWGVRHLLRR